MEYSCCKKQLPGSCKYQSLIGMEYSKTQHQSL